MLLRILPCLSHHCLLPLLWNHTLSSAHCCKMLFSHIDDLSPGISIKNSVCNVSLLQMLERDANQNTMGLRMEKELCQGDSVVRISGTTLSPTTHLGPLPISLTCCTNSRRRPRNLAVTARPTSNRESNDTMRVQRVSCKTFLGLICCCKFCADMLSLLKRHWQSWTCILAA